MATPNTILSYATTTHIPTSGHARISFWSGILSFPILFLLIFMEVIAPVRYLPMNKAGVLHLCLQTVLLFVAPLCALTFGTSALLRIAISRSIIEGKTIAWAGIALGAAYFLFAWPP